MQKKSPFSTFASPAPQSRGPCSPQESACKAAGVVCSWQGPKCVRAQLGGGTAEPPHPPVCGSRGTGRPQPRSSGVPVGAGGPTARGGLGASRCPSAKPHRPPWHPAPSCSHCGLQMFPITLTATSRARRASQTRGLACFCWVVPPWLGKGRVRPRSLRRAPPARALTCLTDGNLAADQLPEEKTRAGSWSTRAKRGLCCFILAAPCSPEGLQCRGDTHGWGARSRSSCPEGAGWAGDSLGWGLRCPGRELRGQGGSRGDALPGSRRAWLKLCPCQHVAKPCGVL